jgi:hypothetical protein
MKKAKKAKPTIRRTCELIGCNKPATSQLSASWNRTGRGGGFGQVDLCEQHCADIVFWQNHGCALKPGMHMGLLFEDTEIRIVSSVRSMAKED